MNAQVSLSGLDVAFLALETPTTPMNVVVTFLLEAPDADGAEFHERIVRLLEERLPRLAPFRRRLAAMPFGLDHPVWIEASDLDVRNHVHRVAAPAPGSERVLAALVARIAAQPLDRTRPLWELSVVEALAEGRVALVFKLHHAIADGISANQLLLRLLDPSAERSKPGRPPAEEPKHPRPTNRALVAHALSRLPGRSTRFVRLLQDTGGTVAGMARSKLSGAGGPEMPPPFEAPRVPWNGPTSPDRAVAYGTARLDDLKLIRSVFGTTVNHVVLAACSQALRGYLEAHGGCPEEPLVAAIPVSLRRADEAETYGNRISAYFVHLPVHLDDPVEQLLAVRDGAESARHRHAELGVGALGEWAEFTSTRLLERAARFYSDRKLARRHRPLLNVVISNVRGPEAPLYAAGARLVAAYPLGPLMEGAAMNITVVSHAGSVDFGVIGCARSVPHVTDIALGFSAAVAQLVKIALERESELAARTKASGLPARRRAPATVAASRRSRDRDGVRSR